MFCSSFLYLHSLNPLPLDETFVFNQPPSDEGGGPLAVEGGKNFPLLLVLSFVDSLVYCSDLNFVI